ncbi:MAG: class I SAM-dependent methyltransferase [Candidatus Hydrogenedentes bacterium]|nr:class I SAM-dependent methyltransferase [Candidatus Hydrogenedentota bacterium]
MTENEIDKNWFASTFDDLYPLIYAHRTVESAAPESEFAVQQLAIGPNDRVLDLCCGAGRHLYHLARHTPHVFGLDYSAQLLATAKTALAGKGLLVRGDMRHLPFENAFDAVTNFFTSFGYFLDSRENHAVVEGVARALRPGGRFFIDYLNAEYVETHLQSSSDRTIDGMRIVEERWIDRERDRVNKLTVVFRDNTEITRAMESVRLYTESEMRFLLEGCGLTVERVFGCYSGLAFSADTPRLILIGRKTGA